ncbi:hypothetical protein, partial [Klebsiella quasivariicola]|uniref:hypothetical protein n=1 Tax=Klebsiella quasivariicola TaxID=2026240 RepID=UPI001D0F536A
LSLSRREKESSGWRLGPCKRSAAGRDFRHGTRDVAGRRLAPCPAYGLCGLPLIYSPFLLKLPVLAGARGYTGGGGDWPPPVRSLRRKRHNAED